MCDILMLSWLILLQKHTRLQTYSSQYNRLFFPDVFDFFFPPKISLNTKTVYFVLICIQWGEKTNKIIQYKSSRDQISHQNALLISSRVLSHVSKGLVAELRWGQELMGH